MSENNILGVVLAGGKSKRFGDDKTTAKLGEKTLLDHTVEKIEKKFDEILIISNNETAIPNNKNVFFTKDLIKAFFCAFLIEPSEKSFSAFSNSLNKC